MNTTTSTKGALTLADYPGDVVRLACERCDRRGQHRLSGLITLYGSGASVPDVLADLARCQKARNASHLGSAHYLDLAATSPTPVQEP